MKNSQRIVLCGGAYSDNLGDAIIADCLSYGLQQYLPDAQIVKMDIAGRQEQGHINFRNKVNTLRMLDGLPGFLTQGLVLFAGNVFYKRRIEPVWKGILKSQDKVVIGGGQLFQDSYLNFPLKIWWLNRNIHRIAGQAAIYSVGVSDEWSQLGKMLFSAIFRSERLLYISVRDEKSRRNLLKHLSFLNDKDVDICPDPALLAQEVYKESIGKIAKEFDVGICIMNPQALHSPKSGSQLFSTVSEGWHKLIRGLVEKGLRVALFTNGAREDEEYLQELAQELDKTLDVKVLERATTSIAYVENVARMRVIIAHRLHANIVSYSLRVPTVGLMWDPKVEQFFTMTNRQNWLFDFTNTKTDTLIEKTLYLLTTSADTETHQVLVNQCWEGLRRLATQL